MGTLSFTSCQRRSKGHLNAAGFLQHPKLPHPPATLCKGPPRSASGSRGRTNRQLFHTPLRGLQRALVQLTGMFVSAELYAQLGASMTTCRAPCPVDTVGWPLVQPFSLILHSPKRHPHPKPYSSIFFPWKRKALPWALFACDLNGKGNGK